jgi:hypothetical protein
MAFAPALVAENFAASLQVPTLLSQVRIHPAMEAKRGRVAIGSTRKGIIGWSVPFKAPKLFILFFGEKG